MKDRTLPPQWEASRAKISKVSVFLGRKEFNLKKHTMPQRHFLKHDSDESKHDDDDDDDDDGDDDYYSRSWWGENNKS